MTIKYLVLIIFIICAISCSSISKDNYKNKKLIATCQENQGMITYEVFLYNDLTFYQEENTLVDKSYGEYNFTWDGIEFNTKGGQINLCKKYKFTYNKRELFPSDSCNSDFLSFFAEETK